MRARALFRHLPVSRMADGIRLHAAAWCWRQAPPAHALEWVFILVLVRPRSSTRRAARAHRVDGRCSSPTAALVCLGRCPPPARRMGRWPPAGRGRRLFDLASICRPYTFWAGVIGGAF
jgi:hypothetical protein